MAAASGPDLAILALGLPVMDGHDLAQQLKALLKPASIHLVAITGYGHAVDHRRTRRPGSTNISSSLFNSRTPRQELSSQCPREALQPSIVRGVGQHLATVEQIGQPALDRGESSVSGLQRDEGADPLVMANEHAPISEALRQFLDLPQDVLGRLRDVDQRQGRERGQLPDGMLPDVGRDTEYREPGSEHFPAATGDGARGLLDLTHRGHGDGFRALGLSNRVG
ncbi:MAG: hypothetical protein GEU82_00775 [Luteitalea sp.]|nr:hypothetical protein [Luteitalea sp.]